MEIASLKIKSGNAELLHSTSIIPLPDQQVEVSFSLNEETLTPVVEFVSDGKISGSKWEAKTREDDRSIVDFRLINAFGKVMVSNLQPIKLWGNEKLDICISYRILSLTSPPLMHLNFYALKKDI